MERPLPSRLPWLLLLCCLPGTRPAASPAPSRLRLPLPWPRIPLDKPHHPAWLTTEVPFSHALKSWLTHKQPLLILAGQSEDPRVLPRRRMDTKHLTGSHSGLASWTELHRGKRRAAARLLHAQPMRVGCFLGTCQVQNLRHRLWQLKGRSRGQDSSPMNPNSPHSYG